MAQTGIKIPYQPHLDGLRAISILMVVGFHGNIPFFQGGFIGVDVFFVISGFLITSLIQKELDATGSINIFSFWARRVRRLFPALIVVIFSTLIISAYLLLPISGEQSGLARSAIASALYVSNIYFSFKQEDYFDNEASTSPLLHTWSLSIEEQFYIFWPLLVLFIGLFSKKFDSNRNNTIIYLLILIIIFSFIYSSSSYFIGPSRFTFFGLQARAWELGTGAMLALILPKLQVGRPMAATLGLAGGGALAAAFFTFDSTISYPGFAAALPTFATAGLIASGSLHPKFFMFRLLSWRPMVVLGLLSYSWYLWHWPLLAIARAHSLGEKDLLRDGAIVLFSLFLAALTYRLIESPVRHRVYFQDWSNRKILSTALAASLFTVAGSGAFLLWSKWLATTPQFASLELATKQKGWGRKQCRNNREFTELVPVTECLRGQPSDEPYLILWGDSHADHLLGAVEAANASHKYSPLPRWLPSCPALVGVLPDENGSPNLYCEQFNEQVILEISSLNKLGKVKGVVIASRWSMYTGAFTLAGEKGLALWKDGQRFTGEAAATVLETGLQASIKTLENLGVQVIVVAPLPEQRFEVPRCLARRSSVSRCSIDRDVAEAQRAGALAAVKDAVKHSDRALFLDFLPYLCDQTSCLVERNGVVIFSDDEHLTYAGSQYLGQQLRGDASWQAFLAAMSN